MLASKLLQMVPLLLAAGCGAAPAGDSTVVPASASPVVSSSVTVVDPGPTQPIAEPSGLASLAADPPPQKHHEPPTGTLLDDDSRGARMPEPRLKLPGHVELGDPVTTGSFVALDRVMKSLMPRVEQCQQRALAEDPTVAGSVTMLVKVDASGGVSVSPTSNQGLPAEVVSCLLSAVPSAGFVSSDGKPASTSMKVTLSSP